jgi:hypothetical protein
LKLTIPKISKSSEYVFNEIFIFIIVLTFSKIEIINSFNLFQIGVEEVCGAKLCDGLQDDPCPCLAGTGVEKFCITAKIKVPLEGMDDCYARFRSIKFTKIFFGPNVMVGIY